MHISVAVLNCAQGSEKFPLIYKKRRHRYSLPQIPNECWTWSPRPASQVDASLMPSSTFTLNKKDLIETRQPGRKVNLPTAGLSPISAQFGQDCVAQCRDKLTHKLVRTWASSQACWVKSFQCLVRLCFPPEPRQISSSSGSRRPCCPCE